MAGKGGIELSNVNVAYGTNHVLKDVSLRVEPGEFFAFLGPSGCGKTTLLRLIAGFNQATSGTVRLDGADISGLPPWERNVGLVFQSYALWPHMTVAQNVAFGLEERRLPREEIRRKVDAALSLVGLEALSQRYPAQLSGGQQQRVALARTIAIEPRVLLLDEPLSNLDAKMRVGVRRELRDLQQRLGMTAIFVTHDQEEANAICDRIAVMSEGVVQQVGTPIELYERPANLFVANFLGTANILPGRVIEAEGQAVFEVAPDIRFAVPPGVAVPKGAKLVFRPQHASLHAAAPGRTTGVIRNREFLGSTLRYDVRLGSADIIVDQPFSRSADLLAVGLAVTVALEADRAIFLAS